MTVEQRETTQLKIHSFLEKLRAARGLATRSKLPSELFTLRPRILRAQALLQKRITLNFGQPTKLTDILARLRKETGGVLLVDWQSTIPIGWNTETQATLVVDRQTLQDALTGMLHPMGLDFRVVDGSTLQIIARSDLEAKAEFELYSLNEDVTKGAAGFHLADQLTKQIKARRGPDEQWPAAVRYDPKSHSLLILLPQTVQRRLPL